MAETSKKPARRISPANIYTQMSYDIDFFGDMAIVLGGQA